MYIYNKEKQLSNWTQPKNRSQGRPRAVQFIGRVPGRIWTGSRWGEVLQTRRNSALCGSSASRRGSFPEVPFSPLNSTHTQKTENTTTHREVNNSVWL